MFTIVDLQKKMADSVDARAGCVIIIGEYKLSVGFGTLCYCTPRENVSSHEYTAVELALFKNGFWVYKREDLNAVLGKYAPLWEEPPASCVSTVAGWVSLQVVCDIVNHLQKTLLVPEASKHTKGRCRRCGGYDDYIQDGDLCYRCCG